MDKFTFPEILTKEIEVSENIKIAIDHIQIPKIQRDYAQGRAEESEIRNRFLEAIFEHMEHNREMKLDFVYGSVKKIDTRNYFVPLDGQQRLTTLFLLYWYVGNREIDGYRAEAEKYLSKFSYDTRPTAKKFTEHLIKSSISFSRPPKEEIEEFLWFHSNFRNDATVKSMLNMLDKIHERYNESKFEDFFSRLSILKFFVLPLDKFGLTDELYIKMNARGKQLSNFENFKADLINWINKNQKETGEEIEGQCENDENRAFLHEKLNESISFRDTTISVAQHLSLKLDNEWTGLFWNYVKNKTVSDNSDEEESITADKEYLLFFIRYLFNSYLFTEGSNSDEDSIFNYFYNIAENEKYKYEGFTKYQHLLKNNPELIFNIQKVLDQYEKNSKIIDLSLKASWNDSFFTGFFNMGITLTNRMLFFAVTKYLENHTFSEVEFKNWIRVIWNLIIDPDLRSISAVSNALKLINNLTPFADNIYEALISIDLESFNDYLTPLKLQLKEEVQKAKLILQDSSWEKVFINAESHPLFQGNLSFLMHGDFDQQTFKKRYFNSCFLFSQSGTNTDNFKNYELIKTLLSNFETFDDLKSINNFTDSFDNWQLILRRNGAAQKIICKICDLENLSEIHDFINISINRKSSIIANDNQRFQHIHEQLYNNSHFHVWMQMKPVKTTLSEFQGYYYICRPRSWYDWVMVDSFRNDIFNFFINHYNFRCAIENQPLANTNYYWGTNLHLEKQSNEIFQNIDFTSFGKIKAGFKTDKNDFLPVNASQDNLETGWHCLKTYDINDVKNKDDIEAFAETIFKEVFDRENGESLINKLF